MWSLVAPAVILAAQASAQVTARFPNGATNPEKPSFYPIGAQVNQTSLSRLVSLNGVDDFCLWGPIEPGPESLIGNTEPEVVAYCTKPRNGARLIPDGAIHSAHFIKTPLYVQIHGFWDGTKANIPAGDSGGELDPHGAKGLGNPIGGNVTSNVPTGQDVFYEEWMSFIGADQYCLRICTAETANVTTALQCEHELDIMGCRFVMAIETFYQTNGTFTSCDGDAAAPPGLYPQADGSTSTFRQRYTGTYTDDAKQTHVYTVGQTVTPTAPAFWPKQSNCITYSTISNGVDPSNMMVTAAPVLLKGSSTTTVADVGTTSMKTITSITGLPSPTPSTSTGASAGETTVLHTLSNGQVSAAVETVSAAATNKPSGAAMAAPVGVLAVIGAVAGALALF